MSGEAPHLRVRRLLMLLGFWLEVRPSNPGVGKGAAEVWERFCKGLAPQPSPVQEPGGVDAMTCAPRAYNP